LQRLVEDRSVAEVAERIVLCSATRPELAVRKSYELVVKV